VIDVCDGDVGDDGGLCDRPKDSRARMVKAVHARATRPSSAVVPLEFSNSAEISPSSETNFGCCEVLSEEKGCQMVAQRDSEMTR
jgi:hypothetical protein